MSSEVAEDDAVLGYNSLCIVLRNVWYHSIANGLFDWPDPWLSEPIKKLLKDLKKIRKQESLLLSV